MTRHLWESLAGPVPFAPENPKLPPFYQMLVLSMYWGLVDARETRLFSKTTWLSVRMFGCQVRVKLVCHMGDDGHPVGTILAADEQASFET